MVTVYPRLILLLLGAGGAVALFAFRFDPMSPAGRALRRLAAGLGMLLVWNMLPLPHLGVNPLSAWVAGTLGAPGLGLLAVLAGLR